MASGPRLPALSVARTVNVCTPSDPEPNTVVNEPTHAVHGPASRRHSVVASASALIDQVGLVTLDGDAGLPTVGAPGAARSRR